MKVRNGHVSNSSSSSFIVAAKGEVELQCNGVKLNMKSILSGRRVNYSFDGKRMTTKEFLSYLNDEYCCHRPEENEDLRTLVVDDIYWADDALNMHDEGYDIISYSVDYGDETAEGLIGQMIKSGAMKKIESY